MSRSKWKGPYIDPKQLRVFNSLKEKHNINKITRNSEITPEFLGLTFNVDNGKNFTEITITDSMIGHKFGEFAFTRAKFFFKKKKKK